MRKQYYKPTNLSPARHMKLVEEGHYSFPVYEPSFKSVLVQPRTIMYSTPKVMVVEHYGDFIICVLNWDEDGGRRHSFTDVMWLTSDHKQYEKLHDIADMSIHQYYDKNRNLQKVEIEVWHDVEVEK